MISSEEEGFEDIEAVVEEDGENLHEEEEGDAPEAGAEEAEEAPGTDPAKKTVKPTKVRRPRPKLNAETLKDKKGLTALPSYFERIKFKGKGYEEHDLNVILKTYEYWCHRLFPKYTFDECIEKIEKLGAKKAVQTHVKKIRLDMIYDHEPVLNDTDSEGENLNTGDNFDNLFNNIPDDIPDNDIPETPVELTEEQQEQIRRNKERADQLRRERLRRAQELSQASLEASNIFSQEDASQVSAHTSLSQPQTETITELSEELQERIRLSREKAAKLREERRNKLKELNEPTCTQQSCQNEDSSQISTQMSSMEVDSSTVNEDSVQEDIDTNIESCNNPTVEENQQSDNEREYDVDTIFNKIQEHIKSADTNSSNNADPEVAEDSTQQGEA